MLKSTHLKQKLEVWITIHSKFSYSGFPNKGNKGGSLPPHVQKTEHPSLFLIPSALLFPQPKTPPKSPDCRTHIRKRVSKIAFKQTLPNLSPAAHIFRSTIMTYINKACWH